ncbi:MAG: hemerythrin domain-containing protein [Hyphomonadaceae bacterium]
MADAHPRSETTPRRKTAAPKPGATPKGAMDAVDLLMKDHRDAEKLFAQFEKAEAPARKAALAAKICAALKAHTQIEEEIFYPEARDAGLDDDKLDEAYVEHDAAKKLIAEIEAMTPDDEFFDAKVKVLSEEIAHHVEEEEEAGGLFAQARKSGEMDLSEMAGRLAARRDALLAARR